MPQALLQTALPLPIRRGKVRDIYDMGSELLIVSGVSCRHWAISSRETTG